MDEAIRLLSEFADSLPSTHREFPGVIRSLEILKLANREQDPALDPSNVGQPDDYWANRRQI